MCSKITWQVMSFRGRGGGFRGAGGFRGGRGGRGFNRGRGGGFDRSRGYLINIENIIDIMQNSL